MALTFGSLFAGIGGFDLGLERAGMKCQWQVEIDSYCRQVLAKHWPGVKRYGDVRECGKHNLETVELICGGFPCQPHSLAGKRRGKADDRDLWPQYRRVIEELRPAWVLAENVPGIRTTILDQVLSDLEGLEYSAVTLNIPACAFDAPHRRERIFVVAYTESGTVGVSEHSRKESVYTSRTGDAPDSQCFRHGTIQPESISECEEKANIGDDGAQGIMAYATQQYGSIDGQKTPEPGWGSKTLPHSQGERLQERKLRSCQEQGEVGKAKAKFSNDGPDGLRSGAIRRTFWTFEPPVGRVAYGVPGRVDRLKGLGNAVVPQVIEWIGRKIGTLYDVEEQK